MLRWKMEVTPEQSKKVQEILLQFNWAWPGEPTLRVAHTDQRYLFFDNKLILHGGVFSFNEERERILYEKASMPEVSYDYFMENYLTFV